MSEENSIGAAKRGVWLVWLAVVVASIAIQWPSLRISPPIWQDEVQILDYGRIVLGGDQSYGLSLNADGKPIHPMAWLGCAIQEWAYHLFQDPSGPRISTLLGATLAASGLLGWLLARGIQPWVALLCAAAFYWDPVFAAGFRGARVDCWVMAFALLALLLVWKSQGCFSKKSSKALLILAGFLLGLAGMLWVSAILLIPLVLHETYCATETQKLKNWRSFLVAILLLGWGGLVGLALPFLPKAEIFTELLAGLHSGVSSRTSEPEEWSFLIGNFLASFERSPFVLVFAVISLFLLRSPILIFAVVLAIVGVFLTSPYIHRAVYLLPYFYLAIACCGNRYLAPAKYHNGFRLLAGLLLIGMLLWSAGLTLGARTYIAMRDMSSRDPDMLTDKLRQEIGENKTIYLGSWDAYYAARKLNWRYQQFFSWPGIESDVGQKVLSGVDMVLYRQDDASMPEIESFENLGFEWREIILDETKNQESVGKPRKSGPGHGNFILFYRPNGREGN